MEGLNMVYTVWVGGIPDIENVSFNKAKQVFNYWVSLGYDDVQMEEVIL